MEITYIVNALVMSIAISLGVGCSTVAITQFFAAIADGQIDTAERKMMGVVYLLLRIAMGLILATMIIQAGIIYYATENFLFISPFFLSAYTVVAVLFLNAIGMTMRWVPGKIGPGIQAASWYTLGIMFALVSLGLTAFTYTEFLLVYAGAMVLVVAIVNVAMTYIKR